MDLFCWTIKKELSQITGEATPEFESWATSSDNKPLAPYNSISAEEWASKSLDEARNLLLNLRFDTQPVERTREDWIQAYQKEGDACG